MILAAAAGCFRLGLWQLNRLAERREANALIAARMALPRLTLTGSTTTGDLASFRPVRATGALDLTRQLVRVGAAMDGVPGVVVVTPLILDDSSAILVERGWAPSPDARRIQLDRLDEAPAVTVEGILIDPSATAFPMGEGWPLFVRSLNVDSLSNRYPYALLPWILRRTSASSLAGAVVFKPVALPVLSNGPHLNYAFQWFSFGAIALIGGWFLVFRRGASGTVRTVRD